MRKNQVIFDKKNILVMGGAGFIGSHLCDELVKESKVICIDNFLTGRNDNISHLFQNADFQFINHDIIKKLELEKLTELEKFRIEFQGVQEIYFLASPSSPRDYDKYSIETLLINSVGLRNALDLAVKYKAKFLYVSSPVVYGDTVGQKSVTEDYIGPVNQLGPRACYEEAKRFGETLVENYRLKYDLDTKIGRVFNCYGPRMKLDDGRMIPEMIRIALAGGNIMIHGKKDDIGSYFYISDLVIALAKLMDSGENMPINIASDGKYTFEQIAQKIIELTGSKSGIKYKERSQLMTSQFIANISLAKEKLNWFPIVLLEEGLEKTIKYLDAQEEIIDPQSR